MCTCIAGNWPGQVSLACWWLCHWRRIKHMENLGHKGAMQAGAARQTGLACCSPAPPSYASWLHG